jgi:hypothetical protein
MIFGSSIPTNPEYLEVIDYVSHNLAESQFGSQHPMALHGPRVSR